MRNRFLGIDSWAPKTYTNAGSDPAFRKLGAGWGEEVGGVGCGVGEGEGVWGGGGNIRKLPRLLKFSHLKPPASSSLKT
jgi:hypothetical protein